MPADLQSGATLAHIYMEISSHQCGRRHAIFPHRLNRVALSSLFRFSLHATLYRRLSSFLNVPSQAKLTCIAGVPSCAKTAAPLLSFSFSVVLLREFVAIPGLCLPIVIVGGVAGAVVGVMVVCQRRVTSQDAQCHRGKEPFAPICGLTGRPRRHRRRDRMRPYKPSTAGRGAIEKETVCDHMSPHRPAVAPQRKRPYATI